MKLLMAALAQRLTPSSIEIISSPSTLLGLAPVTGRRRRNRRQSSSGPLNCPAFLGRR